MKHAHIPGASGSAGKNAFRGGTYSLAVAAVVLAILIAVNVFVSALPTARTQYDMSATKLYSVTSNTKVVVNALEENVTLYWVVQSGEEDAVVENLLSKYESLSGHIQVVKKNPDVYPTFAQQYTDEEVPNNSIIVECGDRSRFISYHDIYIQDMYASSFDGEGAITSAIDYVVREELPQVYLLEGHGEAAFPDTFRDQIEKDNLETQTLSLLTADAVPEDAACLMVYAPSSDLSETEAEMLSDYVAGGGKLLVIAGPTESGTLENLYGLLNDYGVESVDGIVVEEDREHYAFQMPYVLLPDMAASPVTDPLMEGSYYPILPISQGLTVSGGNSRGTVSALLTTSESSFSKAALSIEDSGGGEIIWFASSVFLEDLYNAYSSGANVNLAMNVLSSLVGESEAMAIRSKSLDYNYLTISESTSSLLKTVMIGVCPLAYLGMGVAVILVRRRNQNVPC